MRDRGCGKLPQGVEVVMTRRPIERASQDEPGEDEWQVEFLENKTRLSRIHMVARYWDYIPGRRDLPPGIRFEENGMVWERLVENWQEEHGKGERHGGDRHSGGGGEGVEMVALARVLWDLQEGRRRFRGRELRVRHDSGHRELQEVRVRAQKRLRPSGLGCVVLKCSRGVWLWPFSRMWRQAWC